jgi:hypothetical protein
MKSANFLGVVIVALVVSAANAEEKAICHESPRYLIVEGSTEEVGTNFLVKYKFDSSQAFQCKYLVGDSDFEIRNELAEYFLSLQGDFLILDSGTGPDPRGLIIWNIKSRKKVYSGFYSEPYEIKPGYMQFWTETKMATDENCPDRKKWESEGLGAVIETRVRLNFSDFNVVHSFQTRCSPRQ